MSVNVLVCGILFSVIVIGAVYCLAKYSSSKKSSSFKGPSPSACHGLKCKKLYRGKEASPMWVVSWNPPLQGSGPGYTVTYSGKVENSQKVIYTFSNLSATEFSLPGDIPNGIYAVTVTAANQIGQGPPFTQNISIQSYQPILSGGDTIQYKGPVLGTYPITITVNGTFPGCAVGGNIPPSYNITQSIVENNTNVFPISSAWTCGPSSLVYSALLKQSDYAPGQPLDFTFNICNAGMCAGNTDHFNSPNKLPGPSSDINVNFQ